MVPVHVRRKGLMSGAQMTYDINDGLGGINSMSDPTSPSQGGGGMGEGPSMIDLVVMMTRLESKMDALREQQISQSGIHSDHEQRLRLIEQFVSQGSDHEPRIKSLEANKWPLPSLAALISVASLILAFINMKGANG